MLLATLTKTLGYRGKKTQSQQHRLQEWPKQTPYYRNFANLYNHFLASHCLTSSQMWRCLSLIGSLHYLMERGEEGEGERGEEGEKEGFSAL